MPNFFKITQVKSAISMPQKKKDTLLRLGLHKRHQTVYQKITPQQAGMIAAVKELVSVELAEEPQTKQQMREARKSDPGFVVES